VLNNEEMKHLS